MSKKKTSGGPTMTLKDFHGGYIPSDLPLPSAPGINSRPLDRPGFDRQTSFGNPLGRPDYRSRPSSSPAMRSLDDNKTPFLPHSANIGRNFDEDERKPLDGGLGQSRPVIAEAAARPSFAIRTEMKQDLASTGRMSGWQALNPVSQVPGAKGSSCTVRPNEGSHLGVHAQNFGSNVNRAVSGSNSNAWAVNKEVVGVNGLVQPAWSETVAVSKLAHASALDKISSGKWQTKHSVNPQVDVEIIKYPDSDSVPQMKVGVNYTNNEVREYYDATLVKQTERGLSVEDRVRGGKEYPGHERSSGYMRSNVSQLSRNDVISGGMEVQPPSPINVSERPKLKLLPRSKPVESFESPVVDHMQGGNWQTGFGHAENVTEVYGTVVSEREGLDGSGSGNKAVERPKLKLKPRSQPVQQLGTHLERKEYSLFGGARPRELVLKERGIDDIADNHDLIQSPNRPKHDALPKTVTVFENHGMQQKNWKYQQQERQRSPETWHKRPEQSNTALFDAPEGRPGKAASAVELASAFSKPASLTKMNDKLSGQKGNSSRTQLPFSRLMAPTPRSHISGY